MPWKLPPSFKLDTKILAVLLGLIGLGSFLYAVLGDFSTSGPNAEGLIRLGVVKSKAGKNQILRSGGSRVESVEPGKVIHDKDSVESLELGEVSIELENGFRVLLEPNSMAYFERSFEYPSPEIVIIIKKGELNVEGVGRPKSLKISYQGNYYWGEDFKSPIHIRNSKSETSIDNNDSISIAKVTGLKGQLSDDEIAQVLQRKRPDFVRCYGQLLQKDPSAKGSSILNIKIEPHGRVKDVEILGEDLKDSVFRKCMADSVSRLEFKGLQSSTDVNVTLPIKFE
jgi:hypothetical protein